MNTKRIVVVVLIAVGLTIALVRHAIVPGAENGVQSGAGAPESAGAGDDSGPEHQPSGDRGAGADGEAAGEGELAAVYAQSDDLRAFIRDLTPVANGGDGVAARLISQALEECAGYALDPGGFESHWRSEAAKRPNPARQWSIDALDKQVARCRGLADVGPVTIDEQRHWNTKAAENGDTAAKLRAHKNPMLSDPRAASDVGEVVREAIRSGDPAATRELAFFMGIAGERYGLSRSRVSGTVLAGHAWELAACQQGANCGPSSPVMRDFCLHYGVCGYPDLESVYANALLSPADFQSVLRLRAEIVHQLMRGG